MIREWCDQCGSRFEPGFVDYWGNVRPGRCPYACDLGVSDLPEWSTCEVAELFWTAIAHERAEADRQREAERAERTSSGNELLSDPDGEWMGGNRGDGWL